MTFLTVREKLLRALLSVREILENQGVDGLPDHESGLCKNLHGIYLAQNKKVMPANELKRLFPSWPEFSGNVALPIELEGEDKCALYLRKDGIGGKERVAYMWEEGAYAEARRRLLDHCIQELKIEIEERFRSM